MGGAGGAIAGVLAQRSTGRLLDATGGDYTPIFTVCGLAYVTALLVIHLLVPRIRAVELG
jgi:ACS family hexuronate transporter-like MFS transporter